MTSPSANPADAAGLSARTSRTNAPSSAASLSATSSIDSPM
jgi:hypothetical protein